MQVEQQKPICPDHPEEKPDVASSHTWTVDGSTYFKSYVWYCPICLQVVKTDARL
ncbi:hypothetical protein [Paenibacillus naphthalenovorans]|uniref:hypothetical protein n=1 Tax=Paenibacillus naphthalenovorans TaxID=162209 RepID=UPI003D293710